MTSFRDHHWNALAHELGLRRRARLKLHKALTDDRPHDEVETLGLEYRLACQQVRKLMDDARERLIEEQVARVDKDLRTLTLPIDYQFPPPFYEVPIAHPLPPTVYDAAIPPTGPEAAYEVVRLRLFRYRYLTRYYRPRDCIAYARNQCEAFELVMRVILKRGDMQI
jgi:hypothetical protein